MSTSKPIMLGDRFGRWTALEATETRTYPSGATIHFHECRCDCGAVQFVGSYKLRIGHSRSCGCLQAEITRRRSFKHGYRTRAAPSKIHAIWCGMLARCSNPKLPSYPNYGGRGISVCERWLVFENFLADMGEPPTGFTIDRLNNDGNYEPSNCAWRTQTDQARNRRSSLKITIGALTLTAAEWSERSGIGRRTIEARYHAGWPATKILAPPKGRLKPE